MAQRFKTWQLGFAAAGLLTAALAVGCGGGDDDGGGGDDDNGEAGEGSGGKGGTTGKGGSSGAGKGGSAGAGKGGSAGSTGGSTAEGGTGNTGEAGEGTGAVGGAEGGTGGGVTPPGDVEGVISSVCDWEFRCCDAGERAYRLTPFAVDAGECASRLVAELSDNSTENPYLSGPAAPGGLLGTLGYVVDLTRVTVNAEGTGECIAAWEARGCNQEFEAGTRCTADGALATDPCALTNIFAPALDVGDECTPGLTEGGWGNDVECAVGSTCLAAGHPDNPENVPTCVKRGLEGEPCTVDTDCDFNFFCDAGDCTEKSDVGEACSFNDEDSPAPGDEDIQCKAGLSCHPLDLECVAPCTLGYTCATASGDADVLCPEGAGCAPLEVDEATAAFRVCTTRGNAAADLCNSDADCVDSFYCDGTNCQADKPSTAACTAQNECAAGLHCALATTATCTTNLAAMTACTDSYQCGPNSAGCLDNGSGGFLCRNSLIANGDPCGVDAACASGRCEFATAAATETTCVAGADAGDECDAQTADGEAQRCAPGLLCFGELAEPASGECIEQAAPGTACLDPNGDPSAAVCANGGTCTDPFGEGEICTDAAVGEPNGGTGIVCDGS
jgi:hypothetical protein